VVVVVVVGKRREDKREEKGSRTDDGRGGSGRKRGRTRRTRRTRKRRSRWRANRQCILRRPFCSACTGSTRSYGRCERWGSDRRLKKKLGAWFVWLLWLLWLRLWLRWRCAREHGLGTHSAAMRHSHRLQVGKMLSQFKSARKVYAGDDSVGVCLCLFVVVVAVVVGVRLHPRACVLFASLLCT